MALKGCISKAGKALDVDDRKYLLDQLHNSVKDENEILDLLEGTIRNDQRDLVKLIEDQGLTVETADSVVSEESLPARSKAQPEGRAEELTGKVSEETTESAVKSENTETGPPADTQDSAKPKTKDPGPVTVLDANFVSKAEPKNWSTPKNNTQRRSDAGAYSTHRTFDKSVTAGYQVVLSHKATGRKAYDSLGLFKNESEAKKAATEHWKAIYVNEQDIDLGTKSPKDSVSTGTGVDSLNQPGTVTETQSKSKGQGDGSPSIGAYGNPNQFETKFFAEPTPEERAAKMKKSSNSIAGFIAKVAPESPMLRQFIKHTQVMTGDLFELTEEAVKRVSLFIGFEPLFEELGAGDNYNPDFDTIFISGKGLPKFPIPKDTIPEQRVLDLNNKADLAEQILIVEHEITHAYTVPYIEKVLIDRQGTKEELANMAYLDNALMKLEKVYRNGEFSNVSDFTLARVEYILNQPSLSLAMAEFVAIMTAEPEAANAIYKALSGSIPANTLRARITAVIEAIKASFLALTKEQLAADIDAEALQQALLNTFVMGKNMREQKADEYAFFRKKSAASLVEVQQKAMQEQMINEVEKNKGKEKADLLRQAFKDEKATDELEKTNPEAAKLQREILQKQWQEGFGSFGINASWVNKGKKPTSEPTNKASFDYLNYAVSSMLNSRLERQGKKLLGNLHDIMYDKFPLYSDAADKALGIYDGSPALQQFIHTMTGEGADKLIKADTLAQFAAINAQRTAMTNDNITKLENLSKDLKPEEKADLETFIKQMPLHDYFLLDPKRKLKTAESIEAEAELLRKKLWRVNNRAVRDVEQLIDWHVDGNLTGTLYNLDASKAVLGAKNSDSEFVNDLRKYMALESIKRIGAKKFENLLKHEDLMDVIKDNSVANALSTIDNEGSENIRDSLVMDYWKEPVTIRAVMEKDFKMYEHGEEKGWKILQAPGRNKLGIVYMHTVDSTDIAGAYTDIKLSSTDVDVTDDMRKFSGVVETKNGHKLLLTKEQKQTLGLVDGFATGLAKSAAHSIAIKDSQIIRDNMLKKEVHMVIGNDSSLKKLESIIDSDNIDNPWFLKMEEGTSYSKLPAAIRAKYMSVKGRASNVKGFNDNVDLVRKDISHWLLGGSSKSLFENPKLKWAVRILKNLISGAKIGMVVLNPIKIANDNLSNLTYLGVMGVSPTFIAKNYHEISTDFAEYSDIQRQIFQAKLQLVSRPNSTKVKKHVKNLQKRLTKNSIGDIGDKGFINSLGSDLVSRSADTLSGFQADMHKSLEYLLTTEGGKKNYVSHFIMQMQKVGFQAEDFFSYLGDLAGKAKSTQLLQQELDQVAGRLREIKTDDDVVNYVSQFTTSPSSEAVRFGSAMTDLTDVLAKETLYRHLVENKRMSAQEARIVVLDSFPDYKENMPLAVKQLSDAGIIMFPSFWLRIQKIIYRMARDKPVNLATELMMQEALGSNINTIFEANVINKSETFGGLFHTPFEATGPGSVIPMHIFGG